MKSRISHHDKISISSTRARALEFQNLIALRVSELLCFCQRRCMRLAHDSDRFPLCDDSLVHWYSPRSTAAQRKMHLKPDDGSERESLCFESKTASFSQRPCQSHWPKAKDTRACMQKVDGLRCLLNSGDYLIDAKGSTCAFSVETVKYQMRQR